VTVLALGATGCGGGSGPASASTRASSATATAVASSSAPRNASHHENENNSHSRRAARARARASAAQNGGAGGEPTGPRGGGPYAVGVRTIAFVDYGRRIRYPGHSSQPRPLVTVIRYPTAGRASATDRRNAPPLHRAGGFPLVVFGHGFAVTPRPYTPLLQAWARAGYVVAAPVFPLENAHAPGGPNEADLVNQPRDMRFVISRMLAASADPSSPLAGLVSPRRIAVTGQSDGGETALTVAYDQYYLDRRVRAAMILSGAVIPGVAGFTFPSPSPPLLAVQGTADTINPPHFTLQFFALAPRPKFLLWLLGASHLPPYTTEQPQLAVVERVTTAFLDRYLKDEPGAAARMAAAGHVPGVARMTTRP
jgi:dienelactone hydrolase